MEGLTDGRYQNYYLPSFAVDKLVVWHPEVGQFSSVGPLYEVIYTGVSD